MSRTRCEIRVCFTVSKSEHLPEKNGEQMYADDVAEELRDALDRFLDTWYAERGHLLLDGEPNVS